MACWAVIVPIKLESSVCVSKSEEPKAIVGSRRKVRVSYMFCRFVSPSITACFASVTDSSAAATSRLAARRIGSSASIVAIVSSIFQISAVSYFA